MREILSRLRAALNPQAVWLLAVLLAMMLAAKSGQKTESLESRIGRTLSGVDGAGKVEVTIRMKETHVSGGTFGAQRSEAVPCGAVAVAQGADDPLVALALHDALCALLGLAPSSVSIMTGGN